MYVFRIPSLRTQELSNTKIHLLHRGVGLAVRTHSLILIASRSKNSDGTSLHRTREINPSRQVITTYSQWRRQGLSFTKLKFFPCISFARDGPLIMMMKILLEYATAHLSCIQRVAFSNRVHADLLEAQFSKRNLLKTLRQICSLELQDFTKLAS